ncbi:type VII secretion target [Catellatospora sichuanensis]|uniref:type VII secretion target n=1 Tax=Catellatospora sichuanensis TaxID=1969805 RepID=UPI0011823CBD|nr:type VII secretion target [Catellatospora sichuanensis]
MNDSPTSAGPAFFAEPEGLRKLSRQLADYSAHAHRAVEYVDRHTDLSWYDQGLMQKIQDEHDQYRAQLLAWTNRLETLLAESARGIEAAARYYESTDRDTARTFDDKLPRHTERSDPR